MSKNYLMLLSDAYGGCGGIALYNRYLLQALDEQTDVKSIRVIPRIFTGYERQFPQKISYITKAANSKLKYLWYWIKEFFSHRQHDLIICGHINLLPLAARLSKHKDIPLILFIHGVDAWDPPQKERFKKWLPAVQKIITVTNFTRQRFLQWANYPENKIDILPCIVEMDRFTPGPKAPVLLNRYHLENKKVILTLCRLSAEERYKGIDEILEVMPKLVHQYPNLIYMVVGGGDDASRLKAKANSLSIADHVIFTGRIPESEKLDHYRLADVFAMPGRGEGFGIVYLEALASGIPVIGSTIDGSAEALMQGELGILVNPDQSEELVMAIDKALTIPTGKIPEKLSHYSYENFARRIQTILQDIDGNYMIK